MKVYFNTHDTALIDAIETRRPSDNPLDGVDLGTLSIPRSAVTLGNFDGIHRGHRLLFSHTRRLAQTLEGPAIALTFAPHPAKFFRPDKAPRLIDTPQQKLTALAAAGFDATVVLPFDNALAAMSPHAFAEDILRSRLGAQHVVVGQTFTFGHGRQGNVDVLKRLGLDLGFTAHSVASLCDGPREISSSGIREAIEEGNVDLAARWLERPFTLIGRVATGAGRGRTIGIPTANLEPENELIPRGGVYAGYARLIGSTAEHKRTQPWPAVINIGRAPTFEREREIKIEAHLLGFAGDLVGHPLALSFVYRLRPERRFASPEELIAQIQQDIARATDRLGVDASS